MFQGVRTYSNGNQYDGEWKDKNMKERHGKGALSYSDGDLYDGEYRFDKRNGKGVYYWNGGDVFFGEWNMSQRNGKGVYIFSSGDRHEGEYENGKPTVKPTFISCIGERGVFEMVEKRIGTGKAIINRSGERIELMYERGKLIEIISKEAQNRLDFIQENCGCDFQIPLLNKTLLLCKHFLINSNIQKKNSISEFRGLSDISLDVEEIIIHRIILGFKTTIAKDHLFDYFRFFKRLGLKREMYEILRLLQTSPQLSSFKPCFELFVDSAKINENEEIKTWFTPSPKILEEVGFHNSFSAVLFNKMKSFESEVSISSPLILLPFVPIVSFHLKKATVQDLRTHNDFFQVEMASLSVENMFSKLYKENQFNLELLSCDNPPSEVSVHREVLILKSNFFYKMFNFGGRETEELNTTSSVQLVDLGVKEIQTLVHYYYSGEIVCSSLETLVLCCIHCHKYFEHGCLSKLMCCFITLVKKSSESKILDFLKEPLYNVESEELRKILRNGVISGSKGKFDEKKINSIQWEYARESMRKVSEENRRIINENKLLKERVNEGQKRIKLLEEKVETQVKNLKVDEKKDEM